MLNRLTSLTCLLFVLLQQLSAQQTPKTLLWRITGNGFAKPCYLYGTMHTEDKRAYYLGDSVYSSIKFCDGFAMEIDPTEAIDSFLTNYENEQLDIEYKQAIEDDLIKKGPEYYRERLMEFDSMLVKMRKKFEKISMRDINRLERAYRRRMKNDMKTQLDLYLFDMAKKQGKVVGAVEDYVEHMSITFEKDQFDEEAFLKSKGKKIPDLFEWMIQAYADADLDAAIDYSKQRFSKSMLTNLLYDRNNKIVKRLDSLGRIRSTFCAVGYAHLAGDSGLISLLRTQGFAVTPVFSSKKIEPGDVLIENRLLALTEVSDADSNYVVHMPGKPTDYTYITNKLMVRTYKELSNDILMMCGVYEDGKTYRTADKVVDEIKEFFSWQEIKLYDTKKIKKQDTEGYQMTFKNRDGYIRMHIFCHNGKTYMFGAGSREKDSMYSVRCDNYLAGYTMFFNRTGSGSSFTTFTDAAAAFSIGMPSLPKKENIEGKLTSTKEQVTLFTAVDTKSKISYLALIKEPYRGYFPNFDSSIFKVTLSEIKNGIKQKFAADQEAVLLDGYPALKLKITGESDNKRLLVHVVMAFRNNRFFCFTARGLSVPGNEKIFDDYFNSLRFLPHLESPILSNDRVCDLFSVKTPSFILLPGGNNSNDSTHKKQGEAKNASEYIAFDSSTATTYSISSIYPGKYYWAENDTAFLQEQTAFFFSEKNAVNGVARADSLVYSRDVKNGNIAARELLLRDVNHAGYTRLRILPFSDSVFVLKMKGDKELLTNAAADSFFSSFRFIHEKKSSYTFLSKTQALKDDLLSGDSMVCAGAIMALKQGFHFPAADMPLLLSALLLNYQNKTADINGLIAETITKFATSEVPAFIKIHYPALKGKRENIRMLMLNMLAGYKSPSSYELLKSILLNDPPSPANYSTALQHFQQAPALAASFFPELGAKIKDRDMATDVMDLANMLIDSGQLQYDVIKEYEESILETGKKMMGYYKNNNQQDYYIPNIEAVIQLLVKMNQKKATGLLDDFESLQNYRLNLVLVLALAKSDRPLSTGVLDRFCEDPVRRLELYDELFKIGKQASFKGKYATQQSFAEAFAALYTNNQISYRVVKEYDVVAVKEELLNEKKSRFYVLKVKCHYAYEKISYTCIIGPFEPNNSNLSIQDGNEVYVLYQYKHREDEIDMLFNDYFSKIKKIR